MDIKFGTWNVTSLHRPESVTASARGKYWTYGEYRWSDGKNGTDQQRIIIVSTEKVMKTID